MPDDQMRVLLRLRRLAVDEASRQLAECLRVEADAGADVRDLDREVERQRLAASSLEFGDAEVEAFARWLRGARQRREVLVETLNTAEARASEARAVVAAARSAARAVESVIDQRDAEQRMTLARAEQRVVDEVAGRRRN
ncbi:MAG: flagellar FliJ family protein [Acetobacteraceae bacterium]